MNKKQGFENLVKEIHRVNKGWHCFEISNRFLELDNNYLQSYYLKQKNILQKQLEEEYREMIIITETDKLGFLSIEIKDEYQFKSDDIFYKDACHKIEESN